MHVWDSYCRLGALQSPGRVLIHDDQLRAHGHFIPLNQRDRDPHAFKISIGRNVITGLHDHEITLGLLAAAASVAGLLVAGWGGEEGGEDDDNGEEGAGEGDGAEDAEFDHWREGGDGEEAEAGGENGGGAGDGHEL